jgi:hypothetical protein
MRSNGVCWMRRTTFSGRQVRSSMLYATWWVPGTMDRTRAAPFDVKGAGRAAASPPARPAQTPRAAVRTQPPEFQTVTRPVAADA